MTTDTLWGAAYLVVAGLLACTRSTASPESYRLATIDGAAPPVSMFKDGSGAESQLLAATITMSAPAQVTYRWQYRALQSDGRADTLDAGSDTFRVSREGQLILLSHYWHAVVDASDSVLAVDTLQEASDGIEWRQVSSVAESTATVHLLRFRKE